VSDRYILRRRFRPAAIAVVVAVCIASGSCTTRQHDVLESWDSSPTLEFGRCRVGIGHYVGITPLGVTGSTPIELKRVWLSVPSNVDYSAQIAYFDRGYIGGLDGDSAFRKENVRLGRLQGALVPPKKEPFYILLRVVAVAPGRVTIDSVHLDYLVDGRPASHTFPYSLIIDDYTAAD
jgi:hypothetical protein